jgi:alpha-tubulin suppressor-like RCC1 family protein
MELDVTLTGEIGDGTTTNRIVPMLINDLSNVIQVEIGLNHGLALTGDGTVYSWGHNGHGQIGDNTGSIRTRPVPVLKGQQVTEGAHLTGIASIVAGDNNSIAITNDGHGFIWGQNTNNQLMNANTSLSRVPVRITSDSGTTAIPNIMTIDTSSQGTVMGLLDGSVWVIGRNNRGQIGDGTLVNRNRLTTISNMGIRVTETPIRVKMESEGAQIKPSMHVGFNLLFDKIEGANYTFESLNDEIAKVTETGLVTGVRTGRTFARITEKVTGRSSDVNVLVIGENDITVPQIITTTHTSYALKADGTMWAWGRNNLGQIGDGTTLNKSIPTKVDLENIVYIAGGENHALAVTLDGEVYSWGQNNQGQLGDGTTTNRLTPVKLDLENITQVAVGLQHSLALDTEGKVWAWGRNSEGQLGNETWIASREPVQVENLTDVTFIEAGRYTSFAIRSDRLGFAWGYGWGGTLGDGTGSSKNLPSRIIGLNDITKISSSRNYQTLALRGDGTVWGWGYNISNALTNVSGSTPRQIQGPNGGFLTNVVDISMGTATGMVITESGNILGWGQNGTHELSSIETGVRPVPVQFRNSDNTPFEDSMLISLGHSTSLVAKDDGTVWGVGLNNNSQIGDGTTTNRTRPVLIGTDSISLETYRTSIKGIGGKHNIQAKYINGFNLLNPVLTGIEFKFESLNTEIAEVDEKGVVTGVNYGRTYIIVTNEETGISARLEVNVLKEDDIAIPNVEVGLRHSVALKSNGSIWTWGAENQGQLGNGSATNLNVLEPEQITITIDTEEGEKELKFKEVAAGSEHTLALTLDGEVYAVRT